MINLISGEEFKTPAPQYRSNRFLGKDAASRVHAMANVKRAKRRDEMRKNSARRREGQVALHRKFQKGDFPYIQLQVFDFVNPLKELAKVGIIEIFFLLHFQTLNLLPFHAF